MNNKDDNEVMLNTNLAEANIRIIGNKTTTCQVVQLLAYIRHAIKNNMQTTIKVNVGSKVANSQLLFDVNGLEIPDIITQEYVEIN